MAHWLDLLYHCWLSCSMFIKCFRIQFTPQTLDDRHTPGSVCSVVFDEEHLSINSSTGGVSINRHVWLRFELWSRGYLLCAVLYLCAVLRTLDPYLLTQTWNKPSQITQHTHTHSSSNWSTIAMICTITTLYTPYWVYVTTLVTQASKHQLHTP